MQRVRKGDEVVVVAGKDKGVRGRVLQVDPQRGRVKVEKAAVVKRHVRPSQKHPQGGIVEQEAYIHLSNVQVWDPKAHAGCRIRVEQRGDSRVRVSTKSGESFE